MTIWLGIGAQVYKPTVWKPPVSTDGCLAENITSLTTAMFTTTTEAAVLPSERYFPYYKILGLFYFIAAERSETLYSRNSRGIFSTVKVTLQRKRKSKYNEHKLKMSPSFWPWNVQFCPLLNTTCGTAPSIINCCVTELGSWIFTPSLTYGTAPSI